MCVLPVKDIRSEAHCVSAGRTLTLTKDGRVAVPILNPTEKELTIRQGQKIAYALPAFTELIDEKATLTDYLQGDCNACKRKYNQSLTHVKSVCSSMASQAESAHSGRSNFPAKDEVEKLELLPNLEELKDRISPAQLDRLRAVLEAITAVLAKNKADVGRCRLIEHRIDLEPDVVPHHEGARRMAPFKAEKANEEV